MMIYFEQINSSNRLHDCKFFCKPRVACQRPDLSTASTSTFQRWAKRIACATSPMNITLVSASAIAPVPASTVTEAKSRGEYS